jgi:hypothetical protein
MMWNPELDADALAKEYCDLAYGAAGKPMKNLYDFLEKQYSKFMLENPNQGYEISPKAMREIYADNFETLENFYKDAAARPLTVKQRKRLDMFCFDMVMLHRYLKNFAWLKEPEKSIFNISEKQYKKLCTERGIKIPEAKLEKVDKEMIMQNIEFSAVPVKAIFKDAAGNNFWSRSNHIFAIKAETDGTIDIPVNTRKYRTPLLSYIVYTASGEIIKDGSIPGKGKISFFGRKGVTYYIRANAGSTGYNLDLSAIKHAVYSGPLSKGNNTGFHFFGGQLPIPIYFFVPNKTKNFTITLKSKAPGETASTVIYNPEGEKVANLKTIKQQDATLAIESGKYAGNIWKLELVKPESGTFDDTWLSFGEGLTNWFSFSPDQMLIPSK